MIKDFEGELPDGRIFYMEEKYPNALACSAGEWVKYRLVIEDPGAGKVRKKLGLHRKKHTIDQEQYPSFCYYMGKAVDEIFGIGDEPMESVLPTRVDIKEVVAGEDNIRVDWTITYNDGDEFKKSKKFPIN